MPRPSLDPSLPPPHVPPERLFRLLLGRPRPQLPLSFRLPFAPDVALSVQGLTALEDAEVVDLPPDLPLEIRRSEVMRRTVAAVLLGNGRRAFASAEDVGQLTEPELNALAARVFAATHVVNPTRRMVNEAAWRERLVTGAKHAVNFSTALSVWMSVQPVPLSKLILSAPDRYFGLPLADLTDGQLMAYEAARAVFDK